MKTNTEMIEAVKRGERVKGEFSRKDAETPDPLCVHHWRVLFCNNIEDANECSKCGKQMVHACDFDADYA